MKSIKVFYNGEPLRNIYPHATKFQVFKYRLRKFLRQFVMYSLTTVFAFGILYGTFRAGSSFAPTVTYADHEVIKEVESSSPVMNRIAQCESGSSHLGKSGQITVKVNTNGTYDLGKFQINSIWNAQATKLGYDLTKESDNEAFAMWLYKNQGTGAWASSSKCWNK